MKSWWPRVWPFKLRKKKSTAIKNDNIERQQITTELSTHTVRKVYHNDTFAIFALRFFSFLLFLLHFHFVDTLHVKSKNELYLKKKDSIYIKKNPFIYLFFDIKKYSETIRYHQTMMTQNSKIYSRYYQEGWNKRKVCPLLWQFWEFNLPIVVRVVQVQLNQNRFMKRTISTTVHFNAFQQK